MNEIEIRLFAGRLFISLLSSEQALCSRVCPLNDLNFFASKVISARRAARRNSSRTPSCFHFSHTRDSWPFALLARRRRTSWARFIQPARHSSQRFDCSSLGRRRRRCSNCARERAQTRSAEPICAAAAAAKVAPAALGQRPSRAAPSSPSQLLGRSLASSQADSIRRAISRRAP